MKRKPATSRAKQFIAIVPRHLKVELPVCDFIESRGLTECMPQLTEQATTLFIVVAGDNQTPCRFNGRQFIIEWLDGDGVPLYTHDQAIALIDQSYRFLESVGRTAHPILRAVPVFQIKTL